jgi:hypothetical protein
MKVMKGIAFKTIAELIISLFAVGLFLAILSNMAPSVTAQSYCMIGKSISALPVPSSLKPDLDHCGLHKETRRLVIDEPLTDDLLFDYIMNCWDGNFRGRGGQTHHCYELFVRDSPQIINEFSFSAHLAQNNLCRDLPNNHIESIGASFDCGDKNSLFWRIGDIQGSDLTIVIKYDAFHHRVEVI